MFRQRYVLMVIAALCPQAATAAPGPGSLLPATTIRSDFAVLYATLQDAHYDLYAHRPKPEYDAYYQALESAIDAPMGRPAAATLFQKFAAYGRIGHARVDAPLVEFVHYLQAGGTLLPLFIRVDGGRVLLTETAEDSGRLTAGVELLAIDGTPIKDLLQRLGAYVSSERTYLTHTLMEESLPALLWLDMGPVGSVTVSAKAGKRRLSVPVRAITLDQRRALGQRFPTPRLATDFAAREYRALGSAIAYLRPGPFFNTEQAAQGPAPSYEASAFRRFIDASFGSMLAAGTRDLIIDLRNNPGGDNSFSDPMVAWFADRPFRFASSFMLRASAATKADYARRRAGAEAVEADLARMMEAEADQPNGARYAYPLPLTEARPGTRFDGEVWLLINRHSYSNAASVAALVQDYGFGKILGEESADVASNYASVQHFTLPGSGFAVTYPKSHFIRPNGTDLVAGVVPDFALPREPIGTARDVVLEAALKHVKQSRRAMPAHRAAAWAAPRIGGARRIGADA